MGHSRSQNTLLVDEEPRLFTHHSNGVRYTDDADQICSVIFRVSVSCQMISEIKIRHDEPCEK